MNEDDTQSVDEKVLNSWWHFYDGQMSHARHHETLRSNSTTLIASISLGVTAYAANAVSDERLPIIWLFVFLLNVFGLLISITHTVRSRIHIGVAAEISKAITEALPFRGKRISAIRHEVREKMKRRVGFELKSAPAFFWPALHGVILLLIVAMYLLGLG